MAKKLFGNSVKPACKYCQLGTPLEGDKILCPKYGDVKSYSSCKKYIYSPFKRIPKKEISLVHSDVNQIEF